MSEFDPHLKWLGIRETTRPVNHYRLLGVELFEADEDVISMAADRQMAHIRTFQNGPNGKATQKILNELARARRCLLVDKKKVAYDRELRAKLDAGSPEIVSVHVVVTPEIISDQPVNTPEVQPAIAGAELREFKVHRDPNAREKTKRREQKQLLISLLGWISGGLAALGVGAFLLGSGILGPNRSEKSSNHDGKGNAKSIANNSSSNDNSSKTSPSKYKTKTNEMGKIGATPALPPVAKPAINYSSRAPRTTEAPSTNLKPAVRLPLENNVEENSHGIPFFKETLRPPNQVTRDSPSPLTNKREVEASKEQVSFASKHGKTYYLYLGPASNSDSDEVRMVYYFLPNRTLNIENVERVFAIPNGKEISESSLGIPQLTDVSDD